MKEKQRKTYSKSGTKELLQKINKTTMNILEVGDEGHISSNNILDLSHDLITISLAVPDVLSCREGEFCGFCHFLWMNRLLCKKYAQLPCIGSTLYIPWAHGRQELRGKGEQENTQRRIATGKIEAYFRTCAEFRAENFPFREINQQERIQKCAGAFSLFFAFFCCSYVSNFRENNTWN